MATIDWSRQIVLNDPRFHGLHAGPPSVTNREDLQWNLEPGFKVFAVLSPAVKALRPVITNPFNITKSISGSNYTGLAKGITRVEITNFVKELSWSDASNQHYIDATIRLDNKNGIFNFLPQGTLLIVYRRRPNGDHSGILSPYLNLYVWEREKTGSGGGQEMVLRAYDRMYWLTLQPFETTNGGLTYTAKKKGEGASTAGTRNRPSGWTASQIITDMCKIAKVPIGRIAATTKIIVKPGQTLALTDTIANNIWDVLSKHIRGSITAPLTEDETNVVLQSFVVHMRFGTLHVERVLNPLAKTTNASNYRKPINYFEENLVINDGSYSETMSADFCTQVVVSKNVTIKSKKPVSTTSSYVRNTRWERRTKLITLDQLPQTVVVVPGNSAIKITKTNMAFHLTKDHLDWDGIPFVSKLQLKYWVKAPNGTQPDEVVRDKTIEITNKLKNDPPYVYNYPPNISTRIRSIAHAKQLSASNKRITVTGAGAFTRVWVAIPDSSNNPDVDTTTQTGQRTTTTTRTSTQSVTKKFTFNPQDVYPSSTSPDPAWWQKAFGVIRKSITADDDESPKEAAKRYFDLNLYPQRTFTYSCRGIAGIFHGDHVFINSKYFGLKGLYLVQGIQYTASNGQLSMTVTIYADRKTKFLNKTQVDALYRQAFDSRPHRF